MAISERTRRKGWEAAQRLLPGTRVGLYAVGRTGPDPRFVALGMLGAFVGLGFLIWLLSGSVVVPGVLIFLLLQHAMSPPRAVALCDQGIAILSRSAWNGRPNEVVGLYPHGSLGYPTAHGGWFQSRLPDGTNVWLPKREFQILDAALSR